MRYAALTHPTQRLGFIKSTILIQAVALRQQKRMTLGDAIIAGTALAYRLTLITRNTDDFRWIAELKLLNPFDLGETV
jgi:hypothetical protein